MQLSMTRRIFLQLRYLEMTASQMRTSFFAVVGIASLLIASTASAYMYVRRLPHRYLIGNPPSFVIRVVSGPDDPQRGMSEEYGVLKLWRANTDDKSQPLFSLKPTPRLEFSTGTVVPDLLPNTACLWVVYEWEAWSSPHERNTEGILLRIDGGSLRPIWRARLAAYAGNRIDLLMSWSHIFSHFTGNPNYTPTIEVTEKAWVSEEAPVHSLKKPREKHPRYEYDGKEFKLVRHK